MPSTQYLFLFTIGPVQSFIAQARKTRDLYAGSAILGEIINAAIKNTIETGGKIIVPNSDLDAKPNRFLAQIVCEDNTEVKAFCSKLEAVLKEKWIELAIDSLRYSGVCSFDERVIVKDFNAEFYWNLFKNHQSGLGLPDGYSKQICDFLEIYWVAVKRTESYASDYNQLQMLLAGIKNTRQFNQVNEPPGRKCALDGERNALFYRKREIGDAKDAKPTFIQSDANPLDGEATIKLLPGEGLSAVSLAKRFYKTEVVFPSTAEIALMHSLGKISVSEDKNVLQEYEGIFGRLFDEQLYYEENLTENYFKKNGIKTSRLQPANEVHKKIINAFKKSKVCFQKYYAILAFDGDSMGEVWSGSLLRKKDDLNLFQEEMSSQLQQFQQVLAFRLGIYAAYASAYLNGEIKGSSDALNENKKLLSILEDDTYRKYHKTVTDRRISAAGEVESDQKYKTRMSLHEKPKGKTVYAGGDDFLGFVNLQNLFEVMKELREAYDALVSEPVRSNFALQKSLSFSVGVAIAHYKEPLSVVLGEARAAEKTAKKAFENDDKDAFSLSVLKHSGESLRCFYKWKYNGLQLTDALGRVVTKLQDANNGFSNTFIKNIDQEFRPLMNENGEYSGGTLHILSELNRLITRSSKTGKDNPEIGELQGRIKNIYDSNCLYNKSLENFLVSLHICDFIKRKTSDD